MSKPSSLASISRTVASAARSFTSKKIKNFGISLNAPRLETALVLNLTVPKVLVIMRDYLVIHGGLEADGIFRLSPSQEEFELVKVELDLGIFEGCEDVHCVSQALKVWLKELPMRLLQRVNMVEMEAAGVDPDLCWRVVKTLPDPEGSVLHWFVVFCAEVATKAEQNRMTPKNLSICFGPNVAPMHVDPQLELKETRVVLQWLEKVIVVAMSRGYHISMPAAVDARQRLDVLAQAQPQPQEQKQAEAEAEAQPQPQPQAQAATPPARPPPPPPPSTPPPFIPGLGEDHQDEDGVLVEAAHCEQLLADDMMIGRKSKPPKFSAKASPKSKEKSDKPDKPPKPKRRWTSFAW